MHPPVWLSISDDLKADSLLFCVEMFGVLQCLFFQKGKEKCNLFRLFSRQKQQQNLDGALFLF